MENGLVGSNDVFLPLEYLDLVNETLAWFFQSFRALELGIC